MPRERRGFHAARQPTRKRAALLLPAVAAGVLSAACAGVQADLPADRDAALLATSRVLMITEVAARGAPVDLRGVLADGGRLDLRRYHGKVVVINLSRPGCAPCQAEAAALDRAWHALDSEGVQFLGTTPLGDDEHVDPSEVARTYAVLGDPDAAAARLGAREARPTTVLLDRHGRVAARVVGPGTEATFVQLANELLAEPSGGDREHAATRVNLRPTMHSRPGVDRKG